MRHIPFGMLPKSISAIGSTASPRMPTFTSRPSTKRCTSTSSQRSSMASTRSASARVVRTTERCSMPTDASSAAGLQIAGKPTEGIGAPRRTTANFGTGRPARSSAPLTTCLRRQSDVVQLELPVYGRPSSSSTEMTAGSRAATPSIDSQRLKTRSTCARRRRSIHFASGCTAMRTIVLPSEASAASTAATVPRIARSAETAMSALAPSKMIAILTCGSATRRCPVAPPQRAARLRSGRCSRGRPHEPPWAGRSCRAGRGGCRGAD